MLLFFSVSRDDQGALLTCAVEHADGSTISTGRIVSIAGEGFIKVKSRLKVKVK